jgi:hypothetical protein
MPPAAQPWWIEKLAIPGFFILIGAAVGWIVTELREKCQAHRSKRSFLRAIGLELDAICVQLDSNRKAVDESLNRLQSGGGAPHFAGVPRRTVFDSQFSKLRDVDDPLVMEVILLYSDIGALDQMVAKLNEDGTELSKLTSDVTMSSAYLVPARSRVMSALRVYKEESGKYLERIVKLREKLPPRST